MSADKNTKHLILLSEYHVRRSDVAYGLIKSLEEEWVQSGGAHGLDISCIGFSRFFYSLNKVVYRLKKIRLKDISLIAKLKVYHKRVPAYPNSTVLFYNAMGLGDLKRYKETLAELSEHYSLAIYAFDVWEPEYDRWQTILAEIKPDYLFLAYKKSVEYFRKLSPPPIYISFLNQ